MSSLLRNKIVFLILILMSYVNISCAQDVQFSQFYNIPLHLNPGFAGSAHKARGIAHHRFQWPSLDGKFTTSYISADTYFPEYKSGFGVMVMQDFQGSSDYTSTEATLQYSYELHLNSQFSFRPGLQLGYVVRNLDYSKLTFPQQFDDRGQNDFSNPYGLGNKVQYIDVGSGGILYSEDFWLGAAVHHMNSPNQTFMGDVSKLPVKYSFVTGYKIRIKNNQKYLAYLQQETERSIIPTIHYKMQGPSDQLDVGVYALYDMIIAGVWYRGIAVKRYSDIFKNHESIIVLGGVKIGNISFSYSYDIVMSRLSSVRTFGAHEFNLTYIHSKKAKKKRPMKRLPCPSFYR